MRCTSIVAGCACRGRPEIEPAEIRSFDVGGTVDRNALALEAQRSGPGYDNYSNSNTEVHLNRS
jgi:hypothetical protein